MISYDITYNIIRMISQEISYVISHPYDITYDITSLKLAQAPGLPSQNELLADSDHLAYRPCHRRDDTAGTPELIYRCYHRRAASLLVMITGRAQQPEDGPRRRRRRRSRDSNESVAGRAEQLADVGQSYAD